MSEERYEDDYTGVPTEAQLVRRINGYFCDWNVIDQSGRLRLFSSIGSTKLVTLDTPDLPCRST